MSANRHFLRLLSLSLAALVLFAAIVINVFHRDALVRLDISVLLWFRMHSSPWGRRIFICVSWLGSPFARSALTIIVAVVLAQSRHFVALSVWIVSFFASEVVDGGLKHLFHRERPPLAMTVLQKYSYSFPSGHALASLVAYGMLAYLLCTYAAKQPNTRRAIVSCTAVLVIAIGFSRLYLGVHYLSDVIGGYAAGALLLAVCVLALRSDSHSTGP